ncbi:MAG: hypothetical protein NT132_01840 [Microbacterium sp.]|uniref:hypothetical protein n=1 Tax=Microbacterium sp. TaxID=51671 RepID=UPI00261EA943|nr:hypothetical protein [Microbacterium sp.]MCX6501149.1 hypothetical protein [Microbacterium sp.]
MTELFDCPVHWCEGHTWTHGGDGSMPDEWLHESACVPLPAGMTAHRWEVAGDSERWTLRTSAHAEITEAASLAELVAQLDAVSAELRRIAGDVTD